MLINSNVFRASGTSGFFYLQLTGICFTIFEIKHKIGCYRLPNHRRDAHRIFFRCFVLDLKIKTCPNGPIFGYVTP